MNITSDQLMGIFRAVIPGIVAALAHFGIGTDAQNTVIVTAVATGIVAAWSAYTNSQAAMIKSINTADNGVKVVAEVATTAPKVDAPLK